MFALIQSMAMPFGLLLVLLIAILLIANRFLKSRSTPINRIHPGKKHTHACKFDPAEVARTCSFIHPLVVGPVTAANPRIAQVIGAVDATVVKDALDSLSGEKPVTVGGRSVTIATRNSFTSEIELAITYLEEFYRSLGVKTEREAYQVRGKTMYNLIATLPSTVNPSKVLIVGSHLDSTAGRTGSAERIAPGADDDASGTVALMEIARALSGSSLDCTVRLVHFTGEEQGLYGSYVHSDNVAQAKTDLVAMIQMDMIGYCAKPGNRLDIHDGADRNGSHALVGLFAANVKRYGLNVTVFDTHNHAVDDRSDHAGFLDHGYKAVCLSEEFTDDGFNPNYHSVNDRVAAVNLPYMVEVIRLVIATVAGMAGLK